MKIMIIIGTRPEIIRLCKVIERLDNLCELILVNTGQNYDPNLNEHFFKELKLRSPNFQLQVKSTSFPEQAGQIIVRAGELMSKIRPDRLLILGDTNSGLSAICAARLGITVYHMEAGNRCYDDRVPEEINRRIIDQCSHILLPYTHRSKENLLREGFERSRIFVIGNPIYEVLNKFSAQIDSSPVLDRQEVEPGRYLLATLHRSENVDDAIRLRQLFSGLEIVAETYREPLLVSLHPHTRAKIEESHLQPKSSLMHLLKPMGLFDFVKLEKNAHCVLTDSGTVQEECSILNIPNVTLRDVTERAETIEAGSNILTGAEPEMILQAVRVGLESDNSWKAPDEYLEPNVSAKVAKIILGYWHNFK